MNNSKWYGTTLVALSGVLYGTMAFFGTKLLQQQFSVVNLMFWRFFIASLWISLRLPFFQKTSLNKVALQKISSGVLYYGVGSCFYFLASQKIGTGLAMVIFFSYPLIVTLLTYLKKETTIGKAKIYAMGSILVGLFLLKGNGSHALHFIGVIYGLIAAGGYGLYIFSNQHSAKNIGSDYFTLFICAGNSVLFLVLALSSHTFFLPNTLYDWIYIALLSIFATAIPIQLLLAGMKYIDPIKTAVLSVLEPVVTLIIGALLLNETLSFLQMSGCVLILLSVLIAEIN